MGAKKLDMISDGSLILRARRGMEGGGGLPRAPARMSMGGRRSPPYTEACRMCVKGVRSLAKFCHKIYQPLLSLAFLNYYRFRLYRRRCLQIDIRIHKIT